MIIKINGVKASAEDVKRLLQDVTKKNKRQISYTRIINNTLYICTSEV